MLVFQLGVVEKKLIDYKKENDMNQQQVEWKLRKLKYHVN